MKQIELPEEKIQQLAEKYAMEGAEKAIREYYTGNNSPYMKAMTELLIKIAPYPTILPARPDSGHQQGTEPTADGLKL